MVFDFRYHLTTIVAIFLALGIGILVGTAMIGDDGVVREQQKLIVQIENDLNVLRSQNSQYRARQEAMEISLADQAKFIDQLFQDAIADELTGLRCLLVSDPKAKEFAALGGILKAAGMDVTDFTTLPEKWQPTDESAGWDLCLLTTASLPPGIEEVFTKDRIYKPTVKNLNTKKLQYQLVKALAKTKDKLPPRIVNLQSEGVTEPDDLSTNPSIQ